MVHSLKENRFIGTKFHSKNSLKYSLKSATFFTSKKYILRTLIRGGTGHIIIRNILKINMLKRFLISRPLPN